MVQILACRPIDAKSLPEPMLTYCRLDPLEQTSMKMWSKLKYSHAFKNVVCEMAAIFSGENELITIVYDSNQHCLDDADDGAIPDIVSRV